MQLLVNLAVVDFLQGKVVAAFAALYIIWGSTYLAIRFVIESLPSFFMAGTRFLIAGLILYAWTRLRGASRPSRTHWLSAFVVGGLMLMGGHGAVVWAEQWVPSSLTSVLIATVPLWMVLVHSLRQRSRPSMRVVAGLALGFAGVALLVDSVRTLGGGGVDVLGAVIIIGGAFLWACGSLYSRSGKLPQSPLQATSLEMLAGGTLLLLASGMAGEWTRVSLDQVSAVSMVSWLYLIVFGSLVAFTSYIWLLKQTAPERVSTYAYVNPIVAMILGATLASEILTVQNVLATAIVLASVVVITTHSSAKAPKKEDS
jgi:drug/metabolite transporter (DMT)-like permease